MEDMYKVAALYHRYSKKFGTMLEDFNISSSTPYFWPDSIGYLVLPYSSENSLYYKSDTTLINSIKNTIKDYDTVYYRLQEYKIDSIMSKSETNFSLNVVFTTGLLLTNFFQAMPKDDDGNEINNPLFVPGDTKCSSENGVYFLKKYDNIRVGLIDAAEYFSLNGYDSHDFVALHKFHNFSLTVYRLYFILAMQFLKGGHMYDRNTRIGNSGNRLSNRRNPFSHTRQTFWGEDVSSCKRPAGITWRNDS